jgi:hypothetical protein|tara:strand:- start:165 stop:698 length:534 start_codon:yes stop_codon:yes gene_type:complete
MTSILKVDNLQDSSGTGTPYIKNAVLNVIQKAVDTAGSAIAVNNNSDVISQAITPQSTNSKILVRCLINIGGDLNAYGYGRLFRDSTPVGVSTQASGSQVNASFQVMTKNWTYQGYRTSPHFFEFLDSPGTTSSITYKINLACTSANLYLNRSGTVNTNDAFTPAVISTLTLMEIGG